MWKLLLLLISLGFLSGGCDHGEGDPVHIIVPAGFQGIVQIVVDGTDSGGYRYTNGRHEYTIPASGILHVRTSEPFHQWHKRTAADTAGNPIHDFDEPAPTPGSVLVKGFGVRSINNGPPTHGFAIGTNSQIAQFEKEWDDARFSTSPPTTLSS